MAHLDIADVNLMKLRQIQHAILGDRIEANLDEVLARILHFYWKFVHYN